MQRFDVKVTDAKLWKNKHQGRKGTFYTYSIGVSKKMQDGTFKNKYMRVFPKDGLPNDIPNGSSCDIEGFLTLDVFTGRDGEISNFALYANTIKFHDYESQQNSRGYDNDFAGFSETDDDLPF